ncbi:MULTISPECIES: hypothetical protein [Citromicrobium]|uniref:hypothetical protein n=1 Tax=Citromicrobium TaxID=72173 RepID=UPI0001DD0F3A|nr:MULTISPECIES: hypothetical protein [Citromicrobium]ALG60496.1 hypothetical protein WG74_06320 [Citromicrobium sp. JL477]
MKTSDEWNTQTAVDRAADQLLKEAGGDLELVNGNHIATSLGMARANQSIYAKLDDWKKRKREEGQQHMDDAPADLRNVVAERLKVVGDNVLDLVTGLTGKAVAQDRAKAAKTEALLRDRISMLEAEIGEMKEAIEIGELKHGATTDELDQAQAQAAACLSRAERAEAKLEELRCHHDRLLASLKPAQAGDNSLAIEAGGKQACEVRAPAIDISRYDYQD